MVDRRLNRQVDDRQHSLIDANGEGRLIVTSREETESSGTEMKNGSGIRSGRIDGDTELLDGGFDGGILFGFLGEGINAGHDLGAESFPEYFALQFEGAVLGIGADGLKTEGVIAAGSRVNAGLFKEFPLDPVHIPIGKSFLGGLARGFNVSRLAAGVAELVGSGFHG